MTASGLEEEEEEVVVVASALEADLDRLEALDPAAMDKEMAMAIEMDMDHSGLDLDSKFQLGIQAL